MNSETKMRYGSRVWRHGRSRPFRRYHFSRVSLNFHARIFSRSISRHSLGMTRMWSGNEFLHPPADKRAGLKTPYCVGRTRLRILAEAVHDFLTQYGVLRPARLS